MNEQVNIPIVRATNVVFGEKTTPVETKTIANTMKTITTTTTTTTSAVPTVSTVSTISEIPTTKVTTAPISVSLPKKKIRLIKVPKFVANQWLKCPSGEVVGLFDFENEEITNVYIKKGESEDLRKLICQKNATVNTFLLKQKQINLNINNNYNDSNNNINNNSIINAINTSVNTITTNNINVNNINNINNINNNDNIDNNNINTNNNDKNKNININSTSANNNIINNNINNNNNINIDNNNNSNNNSNNNNSNNNNNINNNNNNNNDKNNNDNNNNNNNNDKNNNNNNNNDNNKNNNVNVNSSVNNKNNNMEDKNNNNDKNNNDNNNNNNNNNGNSDSNININSSSMAITTNTITNNKALKKTGMEDYKKRGKESTNIITYTNNNVISKIGNTVNKKEEGHNKALIQNVSITCADVIQCCDNIHAFLPILDQDYSKILKERHYNTNIKKERGTIIETRNEESIDAENSLFKFFSVEDRMNMKKSADKGRRAIQLNHHDNRNVRSVPTTTNVKNVTVSNKNKANVSKNVNKNSSGTTSSINKQKTKGQRKMNTFDVDRTKIKMFQIFEQAGSTGVPFSTFTKNFNIPPHYLKNILEDIAVKRKRNIDKKSVYFLKDVY